MGTLSGARPAYVVRFRTPCLCAWSVHVPLVPARASTSHGLLPLCVALLCFAQARECSHLFTALRVCKQSLGLEPRQRYPPLYQGECDEAEEALRRCVAYAACGRHAKAVYEPTDAERKHRDAAERALARCLRKRNLLLD